MNVLNVFGKIRYGYCSVSTEHPVSPDWPSLGFPLQFFIFTLFFFSLIIFYPKDLKIYCLGCVLEAGLLLLVFVALRFWLLPCWPKG